MTRNEAIESLRKHYAKNAAGLRQMLEKAEARHPRKYNGFTVDQLREHVANYEAMASGEKDPPEAAIRLTFAAFAGR